MSRFRPLLRSSLVLGCAWVVLSACSSRKLVVGEQCPSPLSGKATIAGGDAGENVIFGTSCVRKGSSPCGGPVKLDKQGCIVFVTFDSCGGDICLGNQLIKRTDDGGVGDAGEELDAGANSGTGASLGH